MPGLVTDGAITAGHDQFPPTTLVASSETVFANGKKVVLNGDSIIPHTRLTKPFDTHVGTVQATTSKVFIEGKPVALIGDPISCGDTIAQGEPNISASR